MRTQLSTDHPCEFFQISYGQFRNDAETANHKGVYRVYKKPGLTLRRKATIDAVIGYALSQIQISKRNKLSQETNNEIYTESYGSFKI